jgi:PAS domain S-box-containing protein
MFSLNPYSLGILSVVAGLALWLIARLLMKTVPRLGGIVPHAIDDQAADAGHGEAVLVVQAGGRVLSVNPALRQLFQLPAEDHPNLEWIARRIRPSEPFLHLCSNEGSGRFIIEGRFCQVTSYRLTVPQAQLFMITLRHASGEHVEVGGTADLNLQRLQTITELNKNVAASLDLDNTIRAIIESVEQLLPVDYIEVCVWDIPLAILIPYRYLGITGTDRTLVQMEHHYRSGEGLAGQLVMERTPVIVSNLENAPGSLPVMSPSQMSLRSYLGVPLLVGGELVGTLEAGSVTPKALKEDDLNLLKLFAEQAAVSLHNAVLFRSEQRRAAELSGLAQLTQAFSSVRDPRSLFARLVQSIVPLVEVEIIGFLLFNETQRRLESQVPYYGIPAQFLELYNLPVPTGSQVEQILLNHTLLVSENASEDLEWQDNGFAALAHGASLRETALVPLTSSGHMLGYLQASNHSGGPRPFSQDELHLLTIIANQAAPMIENATLVQQMRLRALRAEALRKIASLASSAANLEEILQFSLQELARLLKANIGAAFLLDPDAAVLRLHLPSCLGNGCDLPEAMSSLTVDDVQFPFTVTAGQHPVTYNSISLDQPIIPFYQNILNKWNLQSAVMVPLIVRDAGIGELWLGSVNQDYFDLGDMQMVSTAAGQLAGVVEQSYLSSQTDESLRRRVEQLTAIMQITRELSTSLDLHSLLQLVYDQAILTTRADCGRIVLLEWSRSGETRLKPGFCVGDSNKSQLSPLELEVLESGEVNYVPDVYQSSYAEIHDNIESVLLVPISYQQKRLGLIELHSSFTDHFDPAAVEIAQSLAAQAAVALANAIQYEQEMRRAELLKRELETLGRLFQVLQDMRQNRPIAEALQVVAEAVGQATPFQSVLISVYEPQDGHLHRMACSGITTSDWEVLQRHSQPWGAVQALLDERCKVGMTYYIPYDRQPVLPEEIHTLNLLPGSAANEEGSWNTDDFLLVPLYDAEGDPLGLISLDAPSDGHRPDQPTFEALNLFGLQVCLIIENGRQVHELRERVQHLETSSHQLVSDIHTVREQLPVLQQKEHHNASVIERLDRQVRQLRAGLEIAVLSSGENSVNGLLKKLAQEMLVRFELDAALIAESTPAGPRLIEVIGVLPDHSRSEALFGQRNPLRQMLEDRRLILISDVKQDKEWQDNPFINSLSAHSLIGLPLTAGSSRSVGVLAVGRKMLTPFVDEDFQIFFQVSRQLEVALQNLQLLSETRRRLEELDLLLAFSRKLAGLEPAGVLQTLVESAVQAVPAAQAAWAGMWDEGAGRLTIQAAAGYRDQACILAIHFEEQLGNTSLPLQGLHLLEQHLPGSHMQEQHMQGQQWKNLLQTNEIHFAQDYQLSAPDLMNYRKATGGALPVSGLLVPFGSGEDMQGVLMLENFDTSAAFSIEEDQNMVLSLTQQAAMALENARLFAAVEGRAAQLQALTNVAGTITSSLRSEDLINLLLDQLRAVVPYETATLWLRQEGFLQVTAASGFADNESRIGLSVAVEDSRLLQEMIATGRAISVTDVRRDQRFTNLLEPDHLSWLGIPLISKSKVTGVIALEKREGHFYTEEHIQAATTFASQAAIALENAYLFEDSVRRAAELDQRSQRLALLNRFSGELAASLEIHHILRLTIQQVCSALGAHRSVIVLTVDSGQYQLYEDDPNSAEMQILDLPPARLLEHLTESQGIYAASDITEENDLLPLHSYFADRQVRSLLSVPLLAGTKLYGWLWISKVETYRFSSAEVELARTISNQAAIAIQNATLFAERQRLTQDLERRVEERTIEFKREHQNTQALLKIITELSASLDLGQVLTRTLGVLNESLGAEQSTILLENHNSQNFQAGIPLMELNENGRSSEKQIASWITRRRAPALADDLTQDARWDFQDHIPAYRSLIAVPLTIGEEIMGTLLLVHRQPGSFFIEQVGLVEATARQISVALNNAELFNLIRDQSENMGSMLRDQQIEASRMRAILEAVADGVLVTDERIQVTLFNASAQRILEVNADKIVGQPMEQFVGMFGRAANSWLQTIRAWSQDAAAYKGEAYSEQINLDNEKIVSVHLAPVIWRSQLLGTVSIFRDITHEVQVDRLKSEFVANVSHELRTPLTSIKGYVEIMLMGASGAITSQQKHFLEIVKTNTERLTVLLNDLLDISRIEAGRVSLLMQQLNLYEIADDAASDIRRRAQEENKPIKVIVQAPSDLPLVYGDFDRVRQVLGNLMINSYNYTPAGGMITITIKDCVSTIQIDVLDTGIGIRDKDQKRIFERFYRGEDPLVLSTSGTGLGLALSKTLVEMHRGRIWFESSGIPGEGSTFSFSLPVHRSEE